MNERCLEFGRSAILQCEVENKRILEVGALNINGSFRSYVESFNPREYIGIDIKDGAGVDKVCGVEELVSEFGENSFDYIICTETLEHVLCWRCAIIEMKTVCKPDGFICITTRSKGFGKHEYPIDCWRYEIVDMVQIFSDFIIHRIERDSTQEPGVFIKVQKLVQWVPNNLGKIKIFRME